jgi:predicted porin
MAEVTISGGLQAELVQIGGDGTAPNGTYAADAWEVGTESSGNYGFLKFSASEDLGGDMKALAVYNLNANVGDSTKAGLDTRDAYVGLSAGALGTVLAGTLNTPYKSSTVGYDPLLMTSFQARGNYGMSALHNSYVSNAVAYANSFAGGMVKVVAAVVLDETQKNDDIAGGTGKVDKTVGKHAKSLSVNVAPISGLDIAVAWIDVTNMGNADIDVPGESQSDVSATKIGAKYSMGAFTVAGQYEMLNKGMTVTNEKTSVAYLAGTFNINDANSISVAVGKTGKDAIATTNAAGTLGYISADDAKYMAVGFKHAFSKNTSVTVGYRVSDGGTQDEYNTTTGLPTLVAANAKETKETAAGVGLRVAF